MDRLLDTQQDLYNDLETLQTNIKKLSLERRTPDGLKFYRDSLVRLIEKFVENDAKLKTLAGNIPLEYSEFYAKGVNTFKEVRTFINQYLEFPDGVPLIVGLDIPPTVGATTTTGTTTAATTSVATTFVQTTSSTTLHCFKFFSSSSVVNHSLMG
jgi:hypothetical protein